jgi:hypothetical protein
MEEQLTRVAVVVSGRLKPRVKDVVNKLAKCICAAGYRTRPARSEQRHKAAMICWFCMHFPQLANMPIPHIVGIMGALGFTGSPPGRTEASPRTHCAGDGGQWAVRTPSGWLGQPGWNGDGGSVPLLEADWTEEGMDQPGLEQLFPGTWTDAP